jgi:oligopeptide transport system ATP-binding protein
VSDTHFVKSWLMHPSAPQVEPPEAVKLRHRKMPSNYAEPVLVEEVRS